MYAPDSCPALASKAPRDRVLRLTVETQLCPQITLRILDLLSRQWIVPLSIAARRLPDGMTIEVELAADELIEPRDALLLAKVQEMPMVRAAALTALL